LKRFVNFLKRLAVKIIGEANLLPAQVSQWLDLIGMDTILKAIMTAENLSSMTDQQKATYAATLLKQWSEHIALPQPLKDSIADYLVQIGVQEWKRRTGSKSTSKVAS